jgi:chromosome segregation ATPase
VVALRCSTALVVLSLAASAAAHGAGGRELPGDPPAVTQEGRDAKRDLDAIASDEAKRSLASTRVEAGRKALARAHGAHLAGDADGARALSAIAKAWADAAGAAIRAATVEVRASAAEARAKELADKVARARSMLAETQARRGQLHAEIARVEEAAKAARERTIEAELQRADPSSRPKPARPATAKPGGRR